MVVVVVVVATVDWEPNLSLAQKDHTELHCQIRLVAVAPAVVVVVVPRLLQNPRV